MPTKTVISKKPQVKNSQRAANDVRPLTDARLVALLCHICNKDEDKDGRIQDNFAYAAHAAARMLSSQPQTSAFEA
jgi:hypothetical protein